MLGSYYDTSFIYREEFEPNELCVASHRVCFGGGNCPHNLEISKILLRKFGILFSLFPICLFCFAIKVKIFTSIQQYIFLHMPLAGAGASTVEP